MADFSKDYIGDFGVPGVVIEPTTTSTYDPYRGIDLIDVSYCSYIEFMTLPGGSTQGDGIYYLPQDIPDENFEIDATTTQIEAIRNTDCNTDFTYTQGSGPPSPLIGSDDTIGYIKLSRIRVTCKSGSEVILANNGNNINNFMYFGSTVEMIGQTSDIAYASGEEACNFLSPTNSKNYYESSKDKRPSLGMFSTTENNIGKDEFTANLPDDIFNQLFKKNFVKNADGRFVEQNKYYQNSLGGGYTQVQEAGQLVDNLNSPLAPFPYKPQGGWGYISMDGAGINLTEENTEQLQPYPNSQYATRFTQHPDFNPAGSGTSEMETITIKKFYWQLLLELFIYLDYSDKDLGTSTIQTCTGYFNGKYGMDISDATNLCNELQELDEAHPNNLTGLMGQQDPGVYDNYGYYVYFELGNQIRMGNRWGLKPLPAGDWPFPYNSIGEYASAWETALDIGAFFRDDICTPRYMLGGTLRYIFPACASYPNSWTLPHKHYHRDLHHNLPGTTPAINYGAAGTYYSWYNSPIDFPDDPAYYQLTGNSYPLHVGNYTPPFAHSGGGINSNPNAISFHTPYVYLEGWQSAGPDRVPYSAANSPLATDIDYAGCIDEDGLDYFSDTTNQYLNRKNCVTFTYQQEIPSYSDMYGYAGFYPYMLAEDENLSNEKFEWATWVIDKECYSYNRCLKFEASDAWDNTESMLAEDITYTTYYYTTVEMRHEHENPGGDEGCPAVDNNNGIPLSFVGESIQFGFPNEYMYAQADALLQCQSAGGNDSRCNCVVLYDTQYTDLVPEYTYVDTISTEILKIANNNEYRTINQYQKIYDKNTDNNGTEALNQYSPLKVSFWMKTLSGDEENPPYVETNIITQNPNVGLDEHFPLKEIYSPDGAWDEFDQVGTTADDYVPVYEILWGQANQNLYGGFYYDWPFNRPSNGTTEYDELYGYAHNNNWRDFFHLNSTYSSQSNFNICSFKYFDNDIPYIMDVTKYLLNNNLIWPGDDSAGDQGGENPMMFDISLSGHPYYTPETYLEYFDNNVWFSSGDPFQNDMGGFILHDNIELGNHNSYDGEFSSQYWYHNVKPRQIGYTTSDVASESMGYPATPSGCAKFVREQMLPFLNGDPMLNQTYKFGTGYSGTTIDNNGTFSGYTSTTPNIERSRLAESGINAYDEELNTSAHSSADLSQRQGQDFKFFMQNKYDLSGYDPNYWDLRNEEIVDFKITENNENNNPKEITFTKYTVYGVPGTFQQPYNIEHFYNQNYLFSQGSYNSIHSDKLFESSNFGSMNRFKNSKNNTWEKFEYTFNLDDEHIIQGFNKDVEDLYFLIQTSGTELGGFRGKVLLDNFEVKESYDFIPDCDVRKKKGPDNYGIANLTKYYDPSIPEQRLAYNDSTAPLEVQFYFYPKYYYNNPIAEWPLSKNHSIIYNDFRNELFYLYDVNWGDGTPNEFLSEPQKLGENIAVYHTYESSGVFEITGTMLRLKVNRDLEPIGVVNNQRFVLRININEGLDEDFEYFGADGFMFTPYKNSSPIIGGISEQSIYYKTVKRHLGIVSDEILVDTEFESDGDRLKTEIAFNKMNSSYQDNFKVLEEFKKPRNTEPDGGGENINNGIKISTEELGKSIGDTDLTNIRYFNKPKQIWEMLGFKVDNVEFNLVPQELGLSFGEYNTYDWNLPSLEINTDNIPPQIKSIFGVNTSTTYISTTDSWVGSLDILETGNAYMFIVEDYFIWNPYASNLLTQQHPGNPSSQFYWKKIIPKDYSIFERSGIDTSTGLLRQGIEASPDEQDWIFSGLYQYPTLPKYGADGKFVDIEYDSGGNIIGGYPYTGEGHGVGSNILFPLEGAITNEKFTDENLIISIYNENIESNVFDDASGNQNYAFTFGDYKPQFDIETLKPERVSTTSRLKTSTQDGAF